jgi:hypothetical protein
LRWRGASSVTSIGTAIQRLDATNAGVVFAAVTNVNLLAVPANPSAHQSKREAEASDRDVVIRAIVPLFSDAFPFSVNAVPLRR